MSRCSSSSDAIFPDSFSVFLHLSWIVHALVQLVPYEGCQDQKSFPCNNQYGLER